MHKINIINIRIKRTKNNLFVSLSNSNDQIINSLSFGCAGFGVTDRREYYSTFVLAMRAGRYARLKLRNARATVEFIGPVYHRKAIIAGLVRSGIGINLLLGRDINPHGGCRLKKKRRK